jgi:hypothetical protein
MTQSGTLRVSAPETPVTPDMPVVPVTPVTPVAPVVAGLPSILDTVRTDATDPHLGDMQSPGDAPSATPLVQTRTDSSSDGSRLPDDAWPGHVCRM